VSLVALEKKTQTSETHDSYNCVIIVYAMQTSDEYRLYATLEHTAKVTDF